MQLQEQETFTIEGPQLEVFGEMETKLPAPLKKRSTGGMALVALALVAVLGIGGAKLRGVHSGVTALYTTQNSFGQSIVADLDLRADAAANLIRMCGSLLGTDAPEVAAAQQALDDWNATTAAHPAQQYSANTALGSAVDAMYQAAKGQAGQKLDAISTQYNEFLSRQDIVQREVATGYNKKAEAYNKKVSGFPANVIGMLWGAGKVELYG
ncbi:MAG: hypothetical protein PHO10_04855 [Gemmiger sp.]|nr:hypothetical protein [Gemmiger sp.]